MAKGANSGAAWPGTVAFLLSTIVCASVGLHFHYKLPPPVTTLVDPITGLPHISESAILEKTRHLSETIGYRTVGTKEHALAEEWLLDEAEALKAHCDELVAQSGRHLQCEYHRQQGSGTHRFDMMDKRVYKNYVGLTNIVFRISNGTESSKEHSILVNAHLDSTLPSPGAADDALPAMIMLDSIRVLLDTPDWTPQYSIVYLWNNAEESLQDGSHLFSTQNVWAASTRAVLNLEAAGTTGPELLFQATSEEMIEAYSHVPWPSGTVVANDVFSSGIIMSDTDFRQFQEYGNLTGLDMAIVGDSYLYHTRRDVVENIAPGVTQHMADNTLALLLYLTSPSSPIPRMNEYTPPQTTYFSLFGRYFLQWKFTTASRMYNTFFGVSLVLVFAFLPSPPHAIPHYAVALGGIAGSLVASIVAVDVVAIAMKMGLNRGMSWHAYEWSPLVLYGPPALLGSLSVQYVLGGLAKFSTSTTLERTSISVLHLFFTGLSALGQFFGLGSSVLGFVWGLSSFAALLANNVVGDGEGRASALVYAVGQVVPATLGAVTAASALDIFVPLTGRMGEEAPAENIIAIITAVVYFLSVPFLIPFAHHLPRRTLRSVLQALAGISALMMLVFASGVIPRFNELHPRRFFVMHSEDINTGEVSLHVSVADSAPGFPAFVELFAKDFGTPGSPPPLPIKMDDWNADWDVLYPFSQFLTPYNIQLTPPQSNHVSAWSSFSVTVQSDVWHEFNNSRSLSLLITHPDIIWTVLGFDAHVSSWSLDSNPLPYRTRHHVKEASFYGTDTWSLDLTIVGSEEGVKPELEVSFQGIQERGMWPGKKAAGMDLDSMRLFERMDGWIDRTVDKSFDSLMMGLVGGKVTI